MWSSFRKRACSGTSVLLAALAVTVPAKEAAAVDWSLKALLSETTLYNDNRRLEPVSPGGVFGALSALSLDLGAVTPSFHLDLTAKLTYPYYTGPVTYASDNTFDASFYGTADYQRKIGPNTFSLSGSVTPEDAATTQLTDTGQITLNATRWTYNVQGGVDHDIDRLNTLKLAATSTMVRFNGDDAPEFTGYDSTSASLAWLHRLTKLASATTTFTVAHYEFDDPLKPTRDTYGVTTGITSRLTKRLTVNGSGGVRWIETYGLGTSLGATWDASLEYTPLRDTRIALTASRSVAPSSIGSALQDTTSYGVTFDHRLAPRLTVGASYSVSSSTDIDRRLIGLMADYTIDRLSSLKFSANDNTYVTSTDDRHLITVSAGYSRSLTKELTAQLSYKFTRDETTSGVAEAHAVTLTVSRPFDIFR